MKPSALFSSDSVTQVLDSQKCDRISRDMVGRLAGRLDSLIDVPFVGEGAEAALFIRIVDAIDRFVYESLPCELYSLISLAENGVTQDEARVIEDSLTSYANKVFNIPFLSERTEERVFRFVVGLLVRAMVKGRSLDALLV